MRFVFTHAILFSLMTTTGWSQAPFFPFEENGPFGVEGVGAFGNTEPVIWLPTGPFTSDYSDNALTVSNMPFDGVNPSFGGTIVLTSGPNDAEGNPTFPAVIANDLSVEARVRVNSAGTYASIFTRGQNPPPDGDGAAYFGRITGDGALGIANFADPSSFVSMPTGLDPINSDVILRVETIGNTVTARARLADPLGPWSDPLSASFASRPPGVFGLGFGFDPNFETDTNFLGADAMATFRSVKAVPEPSTMCLVAFGLLGALGFRRRLTLA